jgi:hypothetical protein
MHASRELVQYGGNELTEQISLPIANFKVSGNPESKVESKRNGLCISSLKFKDGSRFAATSAISKGEDASNYLREADNSGKFVSWDYLSEFLSKVISDKGVSLNQTIVNKRKTYADIKPFRGGDAIGFLVLERGGDLVAYLWTHSKDRLAVLSGSVGDSGNSSILEERAWQIISSWKWRELETEASDGTPQAAGRSRVRVIVPTPHRQ